MHILCQTGWWAESDGKDDPIQLADTPDMHRKDSVRLAHCQLTEPADLVST